MEVAALGLRVDGIEGIDRAATSLDRLADSGKQAGSSVSNLGNQTKPAVRETEALSAAAQKAQIAEQRLAKAAADAGMSTKAMSAALRGVPAQFTDIAVSLQGGMSPLTVFLQQGGQLKDMFGGAGSAARALGGYVLGLVNPFTAAAAAVAALGVAYYKGSKEQDNFVHSIVTSGNASGVTTSQLRAYAQQIDEVVGTQAKAAESLAIFVAAGVRGDDQLRQFTETAIRWEKATGEGVDVVAGKFAALQKDPVTAALKLNETTNFLTKSVYEQIVALDEQGKSAEASAVAMQALDGAMAEGAATIEKNLGSIERGWNAITGAAKGAWDAMLNIGRQVALMDRLANEQDRLLKLETETVGLYERGTHAKRLADQRQRVSGLLEEVAAEEANAAGKKEAARQVAASAAWDKITNKNISDESKLRKELNNVRQAGIAAGAKESEILAIENKLRDEYSKKNKPKAALATSTYGVSELASIMARVKATNDYIKALQEQGTAADKITEGERLANKIQGEIDSGRLKSSQVLVKQKELEAAKLLQSAQEALQVEEARAAGNAKNAEAIKKLESDLALAALSGEALASAQAKLSLNQYATPEQIKRVQELAAALNKAEEDNKRRDSFGKGKAADKKILGDVSPLTGGAFDDQFARYAAEAEKERERYQEAQDRLIEARELKVETNRSYDELEAQAAQQHADRMAQIDSAKSSLMLSSASSAFGALAGIMKNAQGEQSNIYRAMFAASKAFAIADATLNAYNAISKAWASAPFPLNLAAVAATAPQVLAVVSAISGTGLSGMAHDGIDSIPATGTWLLEKGERVTTANTSAKMDSVLERIDARQRNSGSSTGQQGLAPIVNVIEDASRGGEVEVNQDADGNYSTNVFVRSIRNRGEEARALEATYNLTRVGR